jgi:hypothetical protein
MADSDTGHRKAWATGARSSSTVNKPELANVRVGHAQVFLFDMLRGPHIVFKLYPNRAMFALLVSVDKPMAA